MTQASCFCGANVITFSDTPLLKFRCHCTDERKLTGAAFALNIVYPEEGLKVIKGELKTWGKNVLSNNFMTNHTCGQCGSLLYRSSTGYPGVITIKAGCIDLPEGRDVATEYVPEIEIFTRSRVPWVPAIEGAKQEVADFTDLKL